MIGRVRGQMLFRLACVSVVIAACASTGPGARSNPAPSLSLRPEETRALAAALNEVISWLPSDTAAVCVTLAGAPPQYWYSPDKVLLANLRGSTRRVVGSHECPQTHDRMVFLVDSTGRALNTARPASYVDPHLITVREQRLVGIDSAMAVLDAHQGTRFRAYRCDSHREADGTWKSQCRKTAEGLSALPSKDVASDKHFSDTATPPWW